MPTRTTSGIWKLALFKIACCGSPLLVVLLVGSGAVAVVDLAIGAAAIGLVVAGWLLWRRRKACACEVPRAAHRPDRVVRSGEPGDDHEIVAHSPAERAREHA